MITSSKIHLLFIFPGKKFTQTLKEYFLKLNLEETIIVTDCNSPSYIRLTSWVLQRSKTMKVILDESSRNLLCLYYENDLSSLNQTLYQISIIYPNRKVNYIDIKNLIINTSSHFNLEHLLDNILRGNKKRSNYILQQLKTERTINPLVILRTIQYTILLLVILKRQLLLKHSSEFLILLLNKHRIKKNNHILFTQALQRLTLQQLYQVITLLLQTEIIIHQEYPNTVWNNFELLIWILCNKRKDLI